MLVDSLFLFMKFTIDHFKYYMVPGWFKHFLKMELLILNLQGVLNVQDLLTDFSAYLKLLFNLSGFCDKDLK